MLGLFVLSSIHFHSECKYGKENINFEIFEKVQNFEMWSLWIGLTFVMASTEVGFNINFCYGLNN